MYLTYLSLSTVSTGTYDTPLMMYHRRAAHLLLARSSSHEAKVQQQLTENVRHGKGKGEDIHEPDDDEHLARALGRVMGHVVGDLVPEHGGQTILAVA